MMDISKRNQVKRGFTLIEILVVIVIATIVISIAIPRIRIINKDRNLRESARVVGSAFANASQRAVIDGSAGVRIVRNGNFVQVAGGQQFAATELSLLRAVPNYAGDSAGAMIASSAGSPQISIRRPLEQEALNIVQAGDSISFGGSSVRYRIAASDDTADPMTLTLDLGGNTALSINNYLPVPANGSTFVVHRRPRLLRSSTVTLPRGNILDLRYSGFEANDSSGMPTTVFEPSPTFDGTPTDPTNYAIDVTFAENGSVDRVFYIDVSGETVSRVPLGSLSFFIREAPDPGISNPNVATADPESLWVSVSSSNGTTNIGYNTQTISPPTEATLFNTTYSSSRSDFNDLITTARNSSSTISANQ